MPRRLRPFQEVLEGNAQQNLAKQYRPVIDSDKISPPERSDLEVSGCLVIRMSDQPIGFHTQDELTQPKHHNH